jgi:hypothetical protein
VETSQFSLILKNVTSVLIEDPLGLRVDAD